MAEFESKINLNVDSTQAIAAIKILQERISAFHSSMAKSGGFANAELAKMRTNLIASINATGSFRAGMTEVVSATDAFTTALEKNKLTMGETFRYTMGSTKTFGRFFKNEMEMINKVARERTKTIQTSYLKMGRDVNGAMQAIKVRPLVLDLKNLETQMMMNAQRIQVMNKLIDTGSTQLLNFGKNTQWAGRQLMVGFTVPLTMMGTIAAKTFMDMEKEIIKLRRVYGDFSTSVQDTDKMVESIKSLATEFTKFGIAAKDTMSLAAEAAAAGATGSKLIDQVTESTRLAVLGNVDQQQAYETTISLSNAFGTATEELAGKIDFLNAVENQTVTSISDLTEAIPKAAPVVKQLGGNVEDLAFFLTAMKEGGINASEGANALKSGLAAIINPTQKATDMLKGMGVNLKSIVEGNAGNVRQMVIDLGNALNDLAPLDRAQAIEQLFGKFQFSRISTLLQNVTKEGTQAQKVLGLANSSAAELAVMSKRELDKVQSSTTFKFQAAWEKFQQALAPVGEQFLKAVTPILDFGTKLLQQFNSWSDGAKNFTMLLTGALGVVGPTLLMAVGLVSNGIANLMKFFAFLARAFTGATKDSATLGMETRYMTEAQLNAAAAATSLGQTHSKLQQIYTSETESLVALTSALNRAVAAQERFGAAGGGSLTRRGAKAPKKYAGGVVSVPGPKGAGDVVPAMLSPGEAVIPADKAQQYGGLINGMIAGNIPGYEDGKMVLAPKSYGTTESTHFNDPNKFKESYSPKAAKAEFAKQQKALLDAGHISSAEYKNNIARFNAGVDKNSNGKNVKLYTSNTAAIDKSINQDFAKGKSVQGSRISSSFGQQGAGAFASQEQHLRKLGASEGTIQKLMKEFTTEVSKQFAGKMDVMFDEKKFAEHVEKGMTKAYEKVLKAEKNASERQIIERQRAIAGSATGFGYQGSDQNNKRSYTRRYIATPDAQVRTGKNSIKITNDILKELKSAGIVGKNATLETVQTELKTKLEKYSKGDEKSRKAINDAWDRVTDAKDPKARAREIAKVLEDKLPKTSGTKATAKPSTPKSLPKPKLDGFSPVDAEGRIWSDEHGNTYENGKYKDANGKATTAKALSEKRLVASGRRGRRNMGAAAVGGSVLAASVVGGTPLDDTINNVMTGSMLSMMLPQKFQLAGGIIIAAALSLKSQIDAFNERMRKATESGMKLADAMSSTNQKLAAMGEQLGTVGISETRAMKNDMLVAGISDPQSIAAGKQIAQSDIGKQTIDDFTTAMSSLGKGPAVESLGNQLGMYIAQGIMTEDQARSFAYAIGQEIGNMTIASDLNMKINTLIGPNGENLSNEPLKVAMQLEQSSVTNFASALSTAAAGYQSPITAGNAGMAALGYGQIATGASIAGPALQATAGKIGASVAGKTAGTKIGELATESVLKSVTKVDLAGKVLTKAGGAMLPKLGEKIAGVVTRKLIGGLVKAGVGTATAETGVGAVLAVAGLVDMAMGIWEIGSAIVDYNKAVEHNAKLSAYAVQQGMNTLQQLQQSKDLVEEAYQKRLAELQAELDSTTDAEKRKTIEADINQLIQDRADALDQIRSDQKAVSDQVIGLVQQDTGKAFEGDDATLKKQAAVTYKDNPILLDAVNSTIQGIKDAGLQDSKTGIMLGIELAYGNIDPDTANAVINAAKDNTDLQANLNLMVDQRGLDDSSTIMQLLNSTTGGIGSIDPFVITMMADPNMDMTTIAALVDLEKRSNGVIPITVASTGEANQLVNGLENTADSYTKEYVVQMNDQSNGKFQTLLDSWDEIAGADGVISKQAFIEMQLAIKNPDVIRNWAAENGRYVPAGATDQTIVDMYGTQYVSSLNLDNSNSDLSVAGTRKVTKTSSGGGEDAKLKKLQDQQEKKQKALDVIAIREDRINKKYDERKKALQEIADAQSEITAQQKNQMDLADALSKGDVAAAARAAQEIQAQAAQNAIKQQQDNLDKARQSELDSVSFRGMTRGGLEPQLDKLKELIAIREYELSPKKNTGGGGTYTVTEKTEKPTSPPAGFKATDGKWVYNNTKKTWDWTLNPAPAGDLSGGYKPFSAGHGAVLGPAVPGVDQNGNPIPGYTPPKTVTPPKPVTVPKPVTAPPSSPSFTSGKLGPSGLPPTSPGWTPPTLLPTVVTSSVKLPAIDIKQPSDSLLDLKTKATDLKVPVDGAATSLSTLLSKAKLIGSQLPSSLQPLANASGDISKVVSGKMTAEQFSALYKADGGYITGPGTATSDSILARLSNGEYVVNAKAVDSVGVPFLDAINNMKGFATGGYVMSKPKMNSYATGGKVQGTSAQSAGSVYNYSVVVNAATGASAEEIANIAVAKLRSIESRRIGGR